MNQKQLLTGVVAFVVGVGAGYFINNESSVTADQSMRGSMQAQMDGMMASLEGKRGDAFDQAFLSEMILHHEGAVAMAEAAKKYATHEEITTMADAIISTQTVEIEQMREWLVSWYGIEVEEQSVHHGE